MRVVAKYYLSKPRLVNFLIMFCYFWSTYFLQASANGSSIFMSINTNLSNVSSLMCREEQCDGVVRLAIQCHRETGCLGWFYDDVVTNSCMLCQCPGDPYHYNRHSLVVQGGLHVLDKPRVEKGRENHIILVSLMCLILDLTHGDVHQLERLVWGRWVEAPLI